MSPRPHGERSFGTGRYPLGRKRGATPLCPRCLMATERDPRSDAYLCPSPVCGGGLTSQTVARTPRWRRVIGWWRPTDFERLALASGFPIEHVNRVRALMLADRAVSRAGARLRLPAPSPPDSPEERRRSGIYDPYANVRAALDRLRRG